MSRQSERNGKVSAYSLKISSVNEKLPFFFYHLTNFTFRAESNVRVKSKRLLFQSFIQK